MEYVILVLLIIVILLLIFNLFRKIDNSDMTERLGRFEVSITKEMNQGFNTLNDKMESRLNAINDRVNERLDANFEKTNKTFTSVLERLSKIDEAQKKILLILFLYKVF